MPTGFEESGWTLIVQLRGRATAFNDAGLRFGVADLLNDAGDAIEQLLEELALAEKDLKYWSNR